VRDISSLFLGEVLSHHRRASEDDIQPVEDDVVKEDLWGDIPRVHGQARVPASYGLWGEKVGYLELSRERR
jgi:hypothetical protein